MTPDQKAIVKFTSESLKLNNIKNKIKGNSIYYSKGKTQTILTFNSLILK
jgi:hypothetical protein